MANYQDLLSNLLAVIHADGGHYEAEHGTVKAVTDAIEKVFEMKAHLTKRAPDVCPADGGKHSWHPNEDNYLIYSCRKCGARG